MTGRPFFVDYIAICRILYLSSLNRNEMFAFQSALE